MKQDRQPKENEAVTDRKTPQQPEQQKISENPNPRANENIRPSAIEKDLNDQKQTGSEITDGEDG